MTNVMKQVQASPETAMWQQLENVTAVMLGVEGKDTFMSPMAPMVDAEAKTIWFFTSKDNKHYGSIDGGCQAQICLANEKDNFWACINGWIAPENDRKVMERFWSSKIEAWYEHGIKDDNILLLAFHPEAAELSCSTTSMLRFNWEIAKANLTHREHPHVSTQTRISLVS